MKKLVQILIVFVFALIISVNAVSAASLAVTSIGGVATSGTLTSFTTTDTTPTIIGTASNDATIDITIDDLIVAATADSTGNWSYTPTLEAGAHAVEIASNLETISFTLTVNDGTTTTTSTSSTESSTTTTSTTSSGLPTAGAVENTFLVIVLGMFLIGLGVVAHQILPFSESELE
ncbi:MAG: hypothetical protein A2383_02925 [Candidatus Pacebacteria bacterium RIFOXYB1_FULL_39_46]|nr:MAG: hypothetical protein A2182_01025 [Candidatus Pacebacteria bacterium RIFOXYA1_FULL_38_18]OGJ38793.1 MAG: hypothetical protein A2383_02925 [Candidatus Pacebacteria bacterium RIFOXYB1_FULL_39_46]OGJ39947.1 MAG: hypothetical protein A2582_00955 [Candidatus Pacebacteria bacterium RIFOXYD1_FULL_39_27]OGJ41219.1 MAG: hypothetical protein A2411_00025 [Candidatus Pacebacteria bacterium RIFOXYC1_FULL_39_21]